MKWKNKGQEFDEKYEFYKKHKDIYIWGAGVNGERVIKPFLALEIPVTFVDSNTIKQECGFLGQRVISPNQMFDRDQFCIVIVAASLENTEVIMKQLNNHGFIKDFNCFSAENFMQKEFPVYALYMYDKMYANSIGLLPTTVCNLNCDGCLCHTPYNKNQKHRDLHELKNDLDSFFSTFDYVNLLNYSGGEPLLYPYTAEILEYMGNNYRNQIGVMGMSTNCTIVPSDIVCELFKKYNYVMFLDNYSEYVPKTKEILPTIIEKLNDYGIQFSIGPDESTYWIDLAPFHTDNRNLTEEEMIQYRCKCAAPYRELRGNKIYSCAYASFAIKADILLETENDSYSLVNWSQDKKKELIEFMLGYTNQGYVDFCKQCAGFITINPYKKPVGRQIPRK